jgi:uncharacterized protein (TIGR02186 family)
MSEQAFAELTVDANHSRIKIDFFYHGSTMSIRGISDPGVDLIIKLASSDGHEVLKQKGKVAGVLWMNVGTLKLENAPGVYFLHSTRKIEDILTMEEMEKYAIGYQALQKHIQMNPADNKNEKEKWFNEFVRFKENSRLYSISTGKISLTEKDGKGNYYILTEWPYQVPPGVYTVTVYAVRDGKVVETAQTSITVEQVGVVRTLANMAKDNGALYGIISIVAALGAGFGVGMIFRKGGGAH